MRQVGTEQPPQLPLLKQLLVNDLAEHSYLEGCVTATQPLVVVPALMLLA